MTWQEEARGIEPWAGAAIYRTPGGYIGTAYQVGQVLVYGAYHKDAAGFRLSWHDECVPNLSDPDTCAAFDRRLALRLGAPEEMVNRAFCVVVMQDPQTDTWILHVHAGAVSPGDYIDDLFEWHEQVRVDTDDRLLARVRAWRSVP